MTTDHPAPPEQSDDPKRDSKRADPFVERMFSGFGHAVWPVRRPLPPPEQPYRPLRQSRAKPGVRFRLQNHTHEVRVHAASPATDVMTDLGRVEAITTAAAASIEEAHQEMIVRGVRALFVVDDGGVVLGIITANDIAGERPIQIVQDRGARHSEIRVSEVMTPADLMEAMELEDVLTARVGDVIETLKRSGRQHALVIESGCSDSGGASCIVRGIFSLTQIARQLGLPPQIGHNVARTFAEIEAAIGA